MLDTPHITHADARRVTAGSLPGTRVARTPEPDPDPATWRTQLNKPLPG